MKIWVLTQSKIIKIFKIVLIDSKSIETEIALLIMNLSLDQGHVTVEDVADITKISEAVLRTLIKAAVLIAVEVIPQVNITTIEEQMPEVAVVRHGLYNQDSMVLFYHSRLSWKCNKTMSM